MTTVLVTGADGFIGRHVCKNLVRGGLDVIGLVRDNARASMAANIPYLRITADLSQHGALESAWAFVNQRWPGAVIHLAAQIPPVFLGEEAERAAAINCLIDENVLRFCGARGLAVVYASGMSVCGFGSGQAQAESSELRPVGPYSAAKLLGERLGSKYLGSKGIAFTALRISAPYGPSQRARTVLTIFLDRALRGLPLLYDGSGSRQQDFTYVEDVADAVRCALYARRSGTYNVATGVPTSMRQLATLIRDSVPGCRSDILPSGREDPQERVRALFPVEKAAIELGWRAATSLKAGIQKCLALEAERTA